MQKDVIKFVATRDMETKEGEHSSCHNGETKDEYRSMAYKAPMISIADLYNGRPQNEFDKLFFPARKYVCWEFEQIQLHNSTPMHMDARP